MIRIVVQAFITILMTAGCFGASNELKNGDASRLAWWRDARFGMFIHWGPVSLKGTEIGWSRGKEVPTSEYDQLYRGFNPTQFDAHKWVALAKSAGMKYLVITSKHHDGFSLWKSQFSDYTIAQTPFGRDVLRELSDECRRAGIRFCVYYSILDWHHPDYPIGEAAGGGQKLNPDVDRYIGFMKGQLYELVTRYGPLGVLWFDGEWEKPWTLERGTDLYKYLRDLQPSLIINNRIGKTRDGMQGMDKNGVAIGDYGTPEQMLGKFNRDTPWESCITLGDQWSWKPGDRLKSSKECIQDLVVCAGGDGNLLLNIGPMPSGEIEPRQAERLNEIGAWLRRYGETIYGTRGGPFLPSLAGVSTCRERSIYLHVLRWPAETIYLPRIPAKIVGSRCLTGGKAEIVQTPDSIAISVPPNHRQDIDTIIKLELDQQADGLPVMPWTRIGSAPVCSHR